MEPSLCVTPGPTWVGAAVHVSAQPSRSCRPRPASWQVDRGGAQVEPLLVAWNAAVGDAAVAVDDEPGDAAFTIGRQRVERACQSASAASRLGGVARPFVVMVTGKAGGQVAVAAAWSMAKSSRSNPPGTAACSGIAFSIPRAPPGTDPRLFSRLRADLFGQPYEKSFGPTDVAEPIFVFVLDHFVAYKLRAVLADPGERVVDVVHGEHDA